MKYIFLLASLFFISFSSVNTHELHSFRCPDFLEREKEKVFLRSWGEIIDDYYDNLEDIILVHEQIQMNLVLIYFRMAQEDPEAYEWRRQGLVDKVDQWDLFFWRDNTLFEAYERDGVIFVRPYIRVE